jgi:DNA mismatch endonuclease (patch repair protein)
MKRVRRAGTGPETKLLEALETLGLRAKPEIDSAPVRDLRYRGDLVFRRARVVVLVHGCFWHMCPQHATFPKKNEAWWLEKLTANRL